jgi:hypothetical protein
MQTPAAATVRHDQFFFFPLLPTGKVDIAAVNVPSGPAVSK